MYTKTDLSPRLYFSYGQFMVYDQDVELPGCDWTERHTAQGFARRESTVNFNTLFEFGHADVSVSNESYTPSQEYQRVIAVPFRVSSGTVLVRGPEELPERSIRLARGYYRLVNAQYPTADDEEVVDLYFEPLTTALERSIILVADDALDLSRPLEERAGIAGEAQFIRER